MTYISPFAEPFPDLPPVAGVKIATSHSGIKYKDRDDVFLAEFTEGTTVAGVLTQNSLCGVPVDWCRSVLEYGTAKVLIVNAGVANVFTGEAGKKVVENTAKAVSEHFECSEQDVFISSTGVIGEVPDEKKLLNTIPKLKESLNVDLWEEAAKAIMTTDTFPKGITRTAYIGDTKIVLNGIIKGSGMINPDMATMLGYVFTDAKIPANILQEMMNEDVEISYNSMTVDSDTSTSDTILVFATGQAEHIEITSSSMSEFSDFRKKFREIHVEMAKLVAKDGEGITKFITVNVKGAESEKSAKKIALSIADSPLVKCAVAGEDPNWGRIVMAIGKSGEKTNRDKTSIWIGNNLIAENGTVYPDYSEEKTAIYMKNKEIDITVDVNVGSGKATVWTMDLTYEYIRINVDYRS